MLVLRKIALVLMFMSFAISSKAESHYVPHVSVGAHAGLMGGKVSFAPTIKQGWELGPTAGVSIRYAEEKLVGILAEFNYEQRGWSENFEKMPLSYTRSLSYLSIPVMTHIYFGPPRFKCFFNLGPEFSFLLGQSTSANFDYTDPYQDPNWSNEEKRMTQQYTMQVKNKFDYGICGGFGCEYYLQPRKSVYLEIRYYYGLGNIFSATKADVFSASRNMSLALTLGYNFRIK